MNHNFKWNTREEKLSVADYWWRRQAGKCCLCGQQMLPYAGPMNPRRATIEHIIPRRESGPNTVGNVRLAHQECNNRAGADWTITNHLKFLERRACALSASLSHAMISTVGEEK